GCGLSSAYAVSRFSIHRQAVHRAFEVVVRGDAASGVDDSRGPARQVIEVPGRSPMPSFHLITQVVSSKVVNGAR
ncbi:MAG: hypothetical protein NTZ48_07455, partial [Candidatus Omnitrophica bacterium]|nr:hypothetical protein [Candidatus Omnitrophota bacterium]